MIFTAFKIVFKNKFYIILSLFVTFILTVLATWLPNFRLIFTILESSSATFLEKISFILSLTGSITTNFTWFSASYTVLIALFFSINLAMLIFYIKIRKKFLQKSGVASFGGLISGVFGIGCAACGTVILGPLLALVGAGGIIAYLPLGGQEFGILAIGILGVSIFLTAKKITEPTVCKIDKDK
jgi:phosphoglycerol transferase MdoB-like AlkP superfamily enzyme